MTQLIKQATYNSCFNNLDGMAGIDKKIVNRLKVMFDHSNVLVKTFHMVKDHYEVDSLASIHL